MGNQQETQYEYEGGQDEDDSVAPIFSERVLELIARAIAEYFTGTQILSILKSEGFEDVEYPKTKWKIIYDLFLDIKRGRLVPKHTKGLRVPYEENKIISIIQEFLYPLNHGADEEKAQKLADEIAKFIKYNNLEMLRLKGKYYITDEEGKEILLDEVMEEQRDNYNEEMEAEWASARRREELKKKDLQSILSQKTLIEEIHSLHQAYIDLLEVFCDNPTKPSEQMNGFYLYLRSTLQNKVQSLGLKHFKLNLYVPFNRDLYSAEKEWKDDVLKGQITWDKVRPSLNHFHSEIGKFYRYARRDEEKTTDEKKIEDINNFIFKQKTSAKDTATDLKSISYEQALFITKLLAGRFMEILDADCGGYIKIMNEALNVQYVTIHDKINILLSREDFKDIKSAVPEYMPEDLFEMAVDDTWDVWWSEGGSMSIMSFVGKVNTIWIKAGKQSYQISEELVTLLNETDAIVSNHRKHKAQQWALMTKSTDSKKEIQSDTEQKISRNLYITKKGDDFRYKGKLLSLSKKSNYYKVFCALYALLPNGGEIEYKELIREIKSRMPSTKSKSDEEMRKFIQANLTDKSNGFMRYAHIPQTEDNGKALISLIRGSSVVFNNGPQ